MMLMLLRLMCWIDYCCLRLLPFTSAVKTLELTVVTALRPRCYHSVCPKMCLHVALVTPAFRDVTALYRCSIRVGLPLSHAGVVDAKFANGDYPRSISEMVGGSGSLGDTTYVTLATNRKSNTAFRLVLSDLQ